MPSSSNRGTRPSKRIVLSARPAAVAVSHEDVRPPTPQSGAESAGMMQTERARSEHLVLTVRVGQQHRSMGYSSYPSPEILSPAIDASDADFTACAQRSGIAASTRGTNVPRSPFLQFQQPVSRHRFQCPGQVRLVASGERRQLGERVRLLPRDQRRKLPIAPRQHLRETLDEGEPDRRLAPGKLPSCAPSFGSAQAPERSTPSAHRTRLPTPSCCREAPARRSDRDR